MCVCVCVVNKNYVIKPPRQKLRKVLNVLFVEQYAMNS